MPSPTTSRRATPIDTAPAVVDTAPAAPLLVAPPTSSTEQLLTAAEVAELLRVDVYSVRRWTRRGELQAYRVGRELRIPASAIDTFLGERRNTARSWSS